MAARCRCDSVSASRYTHDTRGGCRLLEQLETPRDQNDRRRLEGRRIQCILNRQLLSLLQGSAPDVPIPSLHIWTPQLRTEEYAPFERLAPPGKAEHIE